MTVYKILNFDLTNLTIELEPYVEPVPVRRLLNTTDFTYLGAFKAPVVPFNPQDPYKRFGYGGFAMAYNQGGGLFLSGHTYDQWVAEITIPTPVIGDLESLPRAEFVQPFTEISGGAKYQIYNSRLGGMVVHEGKIYHSWYGYYGDETITLSHGRCSVDFSNLAAEGLWRIGSITPGYVAGAMLNTPTDWLGELKPLMTGQCGINIISRTSTGPALFGFDPAEIGVSNPVSAEGYVYYPEGDGTRFAENWMRYSGARGGAFISDTEKYGVMLVGTRWIGETWYGGQTSPSGTVDPCGSATGSHTNLREAVAWFYDPNDFITVKNGSKQPWEVRPYAEKVLNESTLSNICVDIQSSSYDPVLRRLYLCQYGGESGDVMPVIHVYQCM